MTTCKSETSGALKDKQELFLIIDPTRLRITIIFSFGKQKINIEKKLEPALRTDKTYLSFLGLFRNNFR